MRNRISTLLTLSGLALSICASTSLAQVAPPPTQPAEKPEAAPAPEPTQVDQTPKKKRRAENANQIQEIPKNIPYPPLAVKGEDGRIIRLKNLPDIAALRSNPTVGPMSVEKIMPVLYGRRARFEILTIDNIDLFWELTDGAIDNLTMSNLKEMTRIADMIKPLVGKTTLSQELLNRGILTRVQGGMNQHIVSEYKKAVGDEIQVTGGDNAIDKFMQFVLADSIHESKLAYQALLAELIPQIDIVVEKAGVNSSAINNILALQSTLNESPEQIEAQINEFDKSFRKLSINEGIAILGTMRQMRENPNISPFIQTVNVLHPRKSIMANSKMGHIIKKGDKVIHASEGVSVNSDESETPQTPPEDG